MIRRLILAGAILLVATVTYAEDKPAAKTPGYVGVKACTMCHKGDKYANLDKKWADSKHAKAFEVLVAKKEDKNPKCLACHTTGFGKGGYAVDAADDVKKKFEGVQCEACHGAGADYKGAAVMKDAAKAAAAGLTAKPDAKVCQTCHNADSPTFDAKKPFKFEEAAKAIDHTYRKK